MNTRWFLSTFSYRIPVATKLHISMSYHCMRPHHLYACVHSVRCVWLWKDIAFFQKPFFLTKKIHFGECQNLTNSNLGIWSIAQKRNPNLSYASKRERANIAFNIKKSKWTLPKQQAPHFSRLRAGQNSGRRTIFCFKSLRAKRRNKNKTQSLKKKDFF